MPAMIAAVHTPIVSKRLVSARRSNGERSRRVAGTAARAAAIAPGSLIRARSSADDTAMIASPSALTISVMASRTSAAYISTWTSFGPASGKLSASRAASVLAGEKSERLIWFELPISIASAMVSPSARPKPSTSAPKMPVDAAGSITLRMASQRVVPMPYAASLTL